MGPDKKLIEDLARENPALGMVMLHNRIGNVKFAQGDRKAALAEYRMAFITLKRLLAIEHEKIGDALFADGNHNEALVEYRAGFKIFETHADLDPNNSKIQRGLGIFHTKIGDVLFASGDKDGALDEYQKASPFYEKALALSEALEPPADKKATRPGRRPPRQNKTSAGSDPP